LDGQGRVLRTIGMVADITERKIGEEALSSVSRRLIDAQEQERARIARELHDDLSQRMALLQIGLTQFEQDTAGLSSKARQQLHDIAEVSTEVSSSIHDLSHHSGSGGLFTGLLQRILQSA
jgi:signal transduction histidine kinase